MNNMLRLVFKVNNIKSLINPVRNAINITNNVQQRQMVRSLWHMSHLRNDNDRNINKFSTCLIINQREAHSRAERELVDFLTEEVLAERKAQKSKTIPTELDGFQAQLNGAEVTLTKQVDNETIKISFNINHTVDTDSEPEFQSNADKPEIGELKSKPAFKIEILRGKTTLNLLCSFIDSSNESEQYEDIFGLDEISIYDGDWNENIYAVSGEVIDAYLYDLILNYLEEKGISNQFVQKLSDYSTTYEHSAYIGLLEGLNKFASGK